MVKLSCVLIGSTICVREEFSWHSEAKGNVYFWATRFGTYDLQRFDGGEPHAASEVEVRAGCSQRYGFSLRFPGMGLWCDCPHAGDTKAVKVETFDIPCPKVRAGLPTRFRDGRWQKCLKSQGWVPA